MNLSLATAANRNVMIVCDRLIKRRNFFDCRACIEPLSCDRFTRRIHARDKKQIVHDPGKPFAFGDGGFDSLAIVGSGAISREGNLRFAQHIGDRRSQFVREIGGKLREPRKRIVEAFKHLVESNCEGLKLARPAGGTNTLLQLVWPDSAEGLRHFSERTQTASGNDDRDQSRSHNAAEEDRDE